MKGNFVAFPGYWGLFGVLGTGIGLWLAHFLTETAVIQEDFVPALWVGAAILGKLIGDKVGAFFKAASPRQE